jgi:hypothetical protein
MGIKHTYQENTETLLASKKQIVLELNDEKTKCKCISHQQNIWESNKIKILINP